MSTGNPLSIDELLKTFLLAAHPVGSYYWSSKDTEPETLFSGKWEQVKDKFILAVGDSYAIDQNGGASTVKLVTANIPQMTTSNTGSHRHQEQGYRYMSSETGDRTARARSVLSEDPKEYGASLAAGNHTHTVGGTSKPFSIMPPYETAYCWKRIA